MAYQVKNMKYGCVYTSARTDGAPILLPIKDVHKADTVQGLITAVAHYYLAGQKMQIQVSEENGGAWIYIEGSLDEGDEEVKVYEIQAKRLCAISFSIIEKREHIMEKEVIIQALDGIEHHVM